MNEELLKKIAEIVAREVSTYSDAPIAPERCAGAAAQILYLVKEFKQK